MTCGYRAYCDRELIFRQQHVRRSRSSFDIERRRSVQLLVIIIIESLTYDGFRQSIVGSFGIFPGAIQHIRGFRSVDEDSRGSIQYKTQRQA